jgi:hypothetical protein
LEGLIINCQNERKRLWYLTYFLANKSLISLISSVCVCIIFFAIFATL